MPLIVPWSLTLCAALGYAGLVWLQTGELWYLGPRVPLLFAGLLLLPLVGVSMWALRNEPLSRRLWPIVVFLSWLLLMLVPTPRMDRLTFVPYVLLISLTPIITASGALWAVSRARTTAPVPAP